jgi:hypothetical protein
MLPISKQLKKTRNKTRVQIEPLISYRFIENDGEALNRAFDILFEETLKNFGSLTVDDN